MKASVLRAVTNDKPCWRASLQNRFGIAHK
jgi:hypothetical protein